MGVAVAVAVDLANASANKAFDLSVDAVAGKATHDIIGGPEGIDERVYSQIKAEGLPYPIAPIVSQHVSSPQLGGVPLQLLGVDPFAEAPFRDYLVARNGISVTQLTGFLTRPGAIFLSRQVADRYGLGVNDTVTLEIEGHSHQGFIAGLLEPTDDLMQRALDGLILTDISTAQELTGKIGKLDRIDVILPENLQPAIQQLTASLPQDVRVESVSSRTGTLRQMTDAFRLNLTALSLLALIVGMFLIYNTMTFSVVQRRAMLGTLRCLGVTPIETFTLITGEALIIGMIGSALGIGLGILLGQGAVQAVTQTINDLYFTLTVRGVQIPESSLIKGGLLGIFATALAAIPPAWEAASVPARAALSRSGIEEAARKAIRITAAGGLICGVTGVGLLAIPTHDVVVSFAGTFAIIIGFALLTPQAMVLLMRLFTPLAGRIWGSLGRLGPRNVVNSSSRTAVAVSALMVAVSVTIGMNVMVSSFRSTVVTWLGQTLQSDVYISTPGGSAAEPSTPIDPKVMDLLSGWPGIERIDTLRATVIESPNGLIRLNATSNISVGTERVYQRIDVPPDQVWGRLKDGAVLVSEPFANHYNLRATGATITLDTDAGKHVFPVIGVYYDYVSSQGTILMSLDTYRQLWHDTAITAIGIRLKPGLNADVFARDLEKRLTSIQQLEIQPNQQLRASALAIFDRTFTITSALQLLATLVAFVGILNALLALELDRQREIGILRAIGLTARQLWGLILLETGLMGLVAGVMAMPTGLALSAILIYIINQRSFGWTLQMKLGIGPFAQALAIAVIAALLAGLYPARRLSRIPTAQALHYE